MGQKFTDGTSEFFPQASFAIWGDSTNGYGVYGSSENAVGIEGQSRSGHGMFGTSFEGFGVGGWGGNVGLWAHKFAVGGGHDAYLGTRCCAGEFYEDEWVQADL